MNSKGDARIQDLLAEGWRLLEAGRCREAADVFGRVLLLDPERGQARRGLEQSRLAVAEEARGLDARMDEARHALGAGEPEQARRLLEEVVARGGDRDQAMTLLDRLVSRRGLISAGLLERRPRQDGAASAGPLPRVAWSRRALVAGWAFVFALLAAGLAVGWESFVERLVKTPAPSRSEAVAHVGRSR